MGGLGAQSLVGLDSFGRVRATYVYKYRIYCPYGARVGYTIICYYYFEGIATTQYSYCFGAGFIVMTLYLYGVMTRGLYLERPLRLSYGVYLFRYARLTIL